MAETMASLYEAKTAKKVYLYRNGFRNTQPKCMIVNSKQIRDFNYFLSRVTSGLHAPLAVRTIYTPSEGHRVKNLDDLQTGHYYVAGVGNENFKKIKYGGELLKSPTKRLPRQEFLLPQRSQQQLSLTAPVAPRYRLPEKPFVIHVFRNGDEKYRGARVLLPRKIMGSWEHVLELVTEKAGLITPAKRICTLDGRTIHAVSEIQDGGKYVALEGSRPFQKVAYCAIDEKKMLLTKARAVARFRHRSDTVSGSEGVDGAQSDSSRSHHAHPAAAARPRRRKKSIRPMAGRKNKEGREKAIMDHREDSIFGGSPDRDPGASLGGQKMPSPPLRSSLTSYYMGGPGDSSKGGASDSNAKKPLRDSSGLHQIDEVAETSPNAPPAGGRSSKQKVAGSPGGGRGGGGGGGRGGGSKGTTPTPAAGGAGQKGQPFHAPPQSSTPKPGGTGTEYMEKSQDGVFRAKSERDEVAGAETIQEGGETQVERPIDQEEAQEVEEEVEQDASGKLGSKNKLQPSSQSHSNKTSPSLSKRASPSSSNKPSPSPIPSNKPSPSPALSNKPSPSPAPSNKPSPAPAPSNKPSPSPAPSNKPSPSPAPSTKPSPAPSTKPSPVPSKKPSPSPAPSNKPSPSPAPSKKPTPSPAQSNKPSPRGGTTPVAATPTPNSSRHSRASQALPSTTTT